MKQEAASRRLVLCVTLLFCFVAFDGVVGWSIADAKPRIEDVDAQCCEGSVFTKSYLEVAVDGLRERVVGEERRLMTFYLDVEKGVARCDFRNASAAPDDQGQYPLVGYRIDLKASNRAYEWEEATKRCCYHNDHVTVRDCIPSDAKRTGEVGLIGFAKPNLPVGWEFKDSFAQPSLVINTTDHYITTKDTGMGDCLQISKESYTVAYRPGNPVHAGLYYNRQYFDYTPSIANYAVFDAPDAKCEECYLGLPLCY